MTVPETILDQSTHSSLSSRVRSLELTAEDVQLLDQTLLPGEVRYISIRTPEEMAVAIRDMLVRGAPAIGIAGAYGVVLSARRLVRAGTALGDMKARLRQDIGMLNQTRPTAVNLAWALGEMSRVLDETVSGGFSSERTEAVALAQMKPEESIKQSANQALTPAALLDCLTREAERIHAEDIEACKKIGTYGASLLPKNVRILTHCNAGALATGGYGTALGIVRSAFAQDPAIRVFADETRPRFQGARLTTWELLEDHIPVTLVADNMSGSLMQAGKIDVVIVGADRITANGDTANKIGTYNLAVLAHEHGVPFYVAAPLSTIDLSLATGKDIPIEERDAGEIHTINAEMICAPGTEFYNPAFDVTPAKYITAIITEKGIARPDYQDSLAAFFRP